MKSTIFFLRMILSVMVISCCSSETAIQGILSGNAEAPMFLDCRAVSPTEISFAFSRSVRMKSLRLDPGADILSATEGEELVITLAQPLEEGARITADILVEDEHRNTLSVLAPLRARNNRMPDLRINEIRADYASPTKTSPAKVEYIEFYSQSSGNLGALRLFFAEYSLVQPVYEFPPVEVQAKDYIVLHLRSVGEGCVDETESDSASGIDASSARDFWIPGFDKLLDKTNAIYLVDQDDRIIDAVLISVNPGASWSKPSLTQGAEFLAGQGAWFPAGAKDAAPGSYELTPADAIITGTSTSTRTLCRDEKSAAAGRPENWYVTVTSGATPGRPNNIGRYVR